MVNIRFLFENLFVNKFELNYAKRIAGNTLEVRALRKDEFGRIVDYQFYFFSERVTTEYLKKLKSKEAARRIFVGKINQDGIDLTEDDFFDKLSTVIDPGIYLNPNLRKLLSTLGHNILPKGLTGFPADILELYSKDCLQFLIGGKGRRYGKERSFESLPDGAIIGKDIVTLFDAKAYKNGFIPSADDLKRFQSYIIDFNRKYEQFTGRVFSFIVVSGHFDVSIDALSDRSRELYEMCQTTLCFISSEELAGLVEMARDNQDVIEAVNWKKILSNAVPVQKMIHDQIVKIKKDHII